MPRFGPFVLAVYKRGASYGEGVCLVRKQVAYAVRDEVPVGKLPLRVDILLIRREARQLSAGGQRDLSVLVPLLTRKAAGWCGSN